MSPYIFDRRGKIHVIDVKQTLRGLLISKKLLAQVVSSGKDVVFVGTKRQAQGPVEKAAAKCGMHYVSHRWLGGTLTNFRTIRSRLQRLEELEALQQEGKLDSQSKKQASKLKREMRKISTNLGGIRKMDKKPGIMVIVDACKEKIALAEANKIGIPTIGIIDTDSDPDPFTVAIPANDDSIRAVGILLDELADAVSIGKTMVNTDTSEQAKPKRRSSRSVLSRAKPDNEQKPVKPKDKSESAVEDENSKTEKTDKVPAESSSEK
jgi:small subunit ribosomal protein S2